MCLIDTQGIMLTNIKFYKCDVEGKEEERRRKTAILGLLKDPHFGGRNTENFVLCSFNAAVSSLLISFPFFKIVLLILLVEARKSECVSQVWHAEHSGDISLTCDMSLKWLLFWFQMCPWFWSLFLLPQCY